MIRLQDIRYVRLGTRDLAAADRYATSVLGLEATYRAHDALYFRSDARDHTLVYIDGDPADHTAGFEVGSAAELDAAAAATEAQSPPGRPGPRAQAQARRF